MMGADDLRKIASFSDFETFINFIARFFPGFNPMDNSVKEIEKAIWGVYFRLIEKILVASPEPMQTFLKNMLLKHEITLVKTILLGEIAKIPVDRLLESLSIKPTEILQHQKLIQRLIKAKGINEISRILQNSPYEKAFENGFLRYKKTNETFHLGQSLDKIYYDNMIMAIEFYPETERGFVEGYIRTLVDIYNLNMLIRSFYNNIAIDLIKPYLIPEGKILRHREIQQIITESHDFESFFSALHKFSKKNKVLKTIIQEIHQQTPESLEIIKEHLLREFIQSYQQFIIEDISLTSIYRIFRMVVQKEHEINEIIKRAVQIELAIQK
jgi:vacuolar-type H+-ATPase subunit C/Vma6